MARIKPPYVGPYVIWRDARPRFQPGPRERALGFENEDLRHQDGRWFSLVEARAWCEAKHAEILAKRTGQPAAKPPKAPPGRTVGDLIAAYKKSDEFKLPRDEGGLADKTKLDYANKLDAILYKPQSRADRKAKAPREREPFSLVSVTAIEKADVKKLFNVMKRERGLPMARGAIMVLSAAWKWGTLDADWRLPSNPCNQLDLPNPPPRTKVWEVEEVRALVRAADHPDIAEYEIGDAVILALFTGQRQSDVLAFDIVGTSDGVTRLVQGKRGKRVEVPHVAIVVARLQDMAARRKLNSYTCAALIVDHRKRDAFSQDAFQKRFRPLRQLVAEGRPELGLAPCPSIRGKNFQDLRDTLITWLKRSGCFDGETAAISGHELQSLHRVLAHYFAPGAEDAKSAITKLEAWLSEKGIAV